MKEKGRNGKENYENRTEWCKEIFATLLVIGLFVVLIYGAFAETLFFEGKMILEGRSNESISAKALIIDAQQCMAEMEQRALRVSRVNESLQQALQLYSAQIALEEKGSSSDYKLVNQSAIEVCKVKDIALKASDEFLVFNESYLSSLAQFDLSSMNGDYDSLIKSFEEERFEDSIKLIDKGYSDLSSLEASQTSFRLYYTATTKNIKDFFVNNWKALVIWIAIIIILLIIFWKTIKKALLKNKLNNLYVRKKSVNELIKKMQYEYFKLKKMSEMEYTIKLKTFNDLIRDIDRQIPEVNEKLARVAKEKEEAKKDMQKVSDKIATNIEGKIYKRGKSK